MCGRAALTASPEDLREAFGLDETPEVAPHHNIPPSHPLSVVRVLRAQDTSSAKRKLESLRWGLVPSWAEDPKIGHKLALARVETVATTPAFRQAIRWRRCLVAVDGFYEWRRDGKASQPFFVRRGDGELFALAGLWERWVSRDGEVIESCAIITQPSRPPVDAIHDRMPLTISKNDWDRWLDPDAPIDEGLLRGHGDLDRIEIREVSRLVNSIRNNGPELIEPAEPEPEQATLL